MTNKEFFMLPKIDFAFKELMENEKVRNGFLGAVLHMKPEEIISTRLMNPNLRKRHSDSKQGILDIRTQMNGKVEINTEIQLYYFKFWPERSLFYLSKLFSDQAKKGEHYEKLNKCISISILDFELFPGEEDYYSVFYFKEGTRNTMYTDLLELHIIELPKLPTELDKNDDLLLWAKFINAEDKEELAMIAQKNHCIKEAYHELEKISLIDEKRMEYEARQKYIRDYNSMMKERWDDGVEKGVERGKLEVASNLLKIGMSLEDISKVTGMLSEDIMTYVTT